MKKYFIYVFAFLFLSCSKNQTLPPEDKNDGKLTEIKQTLFGYSYGELSSHGRDWAKQDFDNDGNLIRLSEHPSINYKSNVNVPRTTNYTYENNVLTEYRDWNWRYKLSYKDGEIYQKDVYSSNGLSRRYIYEYENNQLQKEYEYFSTFDEPLIKRYYTYVNGRVSEIYIEYSSSDNGQLVYKYDDRGNLLTEVYITPSTGKSTIQIDNKYEYDNTGRMLVKYFKESITNYKATYKYDDSNLITEVFYERNISGSDYEDWALVKYDYTYR